VNGESVGVTVAVVVVLTAVVVVEWTVKVLVG
jgi:hypothetical protein